MTDFIKYLTSPFVLDLIRYLRACRSYMQFRKILKKNTSRLGSKSSKVFVLGNGPSLREVASESLGDSDVIVMNSFTKGDFKPKGKVVAHCYGEPQSADSWSVEDAVECLSVSKAQSIWCHFSTYADIKKFVPEELLHPVVPGIEADFGNHISLDLSGVCFAYGTTAQLAIQVAIFYGYDEIILLGFDHDWASVKEYSRHFYSDDRDPFDTFKQRPYVAQLAELHRVWSIYYRLRRYSEKKNIKIVNGTNGSYLDVFERADIKEFVHGGDQGKKTFD